MNQDQQQGITSTNIASETETQVQTQVEAEKILCPHCRRTATNGIKCKGICVADSDY
jgi:NMD protein affecting ribosome stability and mRNA decay